MNKTGQKGERGRYTVILLLVVGLTAFSSAMKDLNNLQHFAFEASHLIAQVSDEFAPAEIPQIPQTTEIQHTAINVATCELKQSAPSVELPWLSNVVRVPEKEKKPRAIVPRPSQVIDFKQDLPLSEYQIAKLKKLPQIDFDPGRFEFRIANGEADAFVFREVPGNQLKNRARKHRDRENRINPRDREMLLKTLNRSINLRFAS